MDLVLCHTTADFDTLGAAVGVTVLYPGARIVLAGGCHPTVQGFLGLHRDEYPLVDRRAVHWDEVNSLAVVDTQALDRLGAIAPEVRAVAERGGTVRVYDHHGGPLSLPATEVWVEAVGATTTLIVEQLRAQGATLTISQATVMALGIHVDTGSLTFASATARDAAALTWLMEQGASQAAISEFVDPSLSPQLQTLLETAIAQVQRETHGGQTLGWVLLEIPAHIPGLSGLAERLITVIDVDSLLVGAWYPWRTDIYKLVMIGRARGRMAAAGDRPGVDFAEVFQAFGGGGHPAAAAATCTTPHPTDTFQAALSTLRQQIPLPPMAQDLMSAPVRTIRPETTITEAQRILLRYGHSGLSVVDRDGQLVGIISRRDIDLALHHGFGHAPVKGYMTTEVKTITPQTTLPEIEALMVTYDIGRLPVLDGNQLVGIVTRTDVLRQLHQAQQQFQDTIGLALGTTTEAVPWIRPPSPRSLWHTMETRLAPDLWAMLQAMAAVAHDRSWHLYLVGGAVRDLFLTPAPLPLHLQDVDLVVDSAHQTLEMGAGIVLAQAVQKQHPEADLQVYGRFQTAALVWHADQSRDRAPLMVDIATARTEFYPYPAANPEVEASSIQQDLYRRDFTLNALAICLTPPRAGQLLDFFGGLVDLHLRQIRVLHANSFIEDPTRIYRAVRFAVRLGFALEPQTEGFIRHAINSGVYKQLQAQIAKLPALQTRLRAELKYILEAPYWASALSLLDDLGALVCLHPALSMGDRLWRDLHRLSRWLNHLPVVAKVIPWQLRLERLLLEIPAEDRATVAQNLQLPQASCDRIATFATTEASLLAILPACDRPSQIVHHLRPHDPETLILLAVCHPRPLGRAIWRYLMHWRGVKTPLNGHDLKQMGYPQGPHFRAMLDDLLGATLDGVVNDRASAIAYLQTRYPL